MQSIKKKISPTDMTDKWSVHVGHRQGDKHDTKSGKVVMH